MNRILVTHGRLDWPSRERVDDRYGAITIRHGTNANSESCRFEDAVDLQGRRGRLVAEVVSNHPSPHIGDFFDGLSPNAAPVGTDVLLGEGTLFIEEQVSFRGTESWMALGLRPDDGRETLWLDAAALYRVHAQVVRLWFEPI